MPAATERMVTSNPAALAVAVRGAGKRNEILVWLKDAGVAPLSREYVLGASHGALRMGVPRGESGEGARRTRNAGTPGAAAAAAVRGLAAAHGAEAYWEGKVMPVVAMRIPDAALEPLLAALLRHPNVDFVEANEVRPAYPMDAAMAPPLGSNPADTKHTMHSVEAAWDYTRGAGAEVGVLDSGYLTDYYGAPIDPDATTPILGFVSGYQTVCPGGNCGVRDDHGHGTMMTGLVGARDNNHDYVGVFPGGTTVTMKIAYNTWNLGGCCTSFAIDQTSFVQAVDYAGYVDYDVLSMSFVGDFSYSVENALYQAYYSQNILLLAAAGNDPQHANLEPARLGWVMAVGGLDWSGHSIYQNANEEIAAFSWGGTVVPQGCPSNTQAGFCSGYTYGFVGGTSSSTATAAGIAGLVRAYNPGLSAAQVRSRLVQTADVSYSPTDGTYPRRINALRAVRGW